MKRSLAIVTIALLVGVVLGTWLAPRERDLWTQVHSMFTGVTGAKTTIRSLPPTAGPPDAGPTLVLSPPPSLTDQLLQEGIELRDRGDKTNALARFEEALDTEPNNIALLEEIAKTYDSMQLYDRANELWRKLHDIGPSAGQPYELADQRLKLGTPTPATGEFGIVNASLQPAPTAVARSKFEQAQQALRERDFARALKLADEAAKAGPNQAATINLRGEILMQQEQFDQAESAFRKATKLDPKLREAQYNLAQIPFKKKEYSKARDRFEALYKRTPGGDKNQAAELIKFKIYMTLLLEGKESRAHAMMDEFQFTSVTPALYYAQAAWEFKHNNPEKASNWTTSANKSYSSALNSVFADAFYDVGWMQRAEVRSTGQSDVGSSLNVTPSGFAKQAMKLREQEIEQVPPLTEPTTLYPAIPADTQALEAIARKDYVSAVSLLEKSVQQGHAPSQSLLASLYAYGKGVPQDQKKAVDLYQKAAAQGNPSGQIGLAFLYSEGKGVPRDYRKAAELLREAADKGYALAQVNLGWFYHEGKGVPQDYRKAVELFEKAADQGYPAGQAYLASAYADGRGVPRDYRKALDLFHKALDQGSQPNVLNDFAWFLATCPDAAQRNGKEAVEYATKACELTEWKSANFIGTLAAAYAEIGDFDTAIKYQKQALEIPDTDYPDRQQMERSIELYWHRKPYREQ